MLQDTIISFISTREVGSALGEVDIIRFDEKQAISSPLVVNDITYLGIFELKKYITYLLIRELKGDMIRDFITPSIRDTGRGGYGGILTILGGVTFLVIPLFFPLEGVREPQPSHVLLIGGILFTVSGIWVYYREVATEYSHLGQLSLWLLAIGLGGLIPFTLSELFVRELGDGILLGLFSLYAVAALAIGAIGIGIDSVRMGVPTRWFGIWFPLILLAPFALIDRSRALVDTLWLGSNPSAALFGIAWIGFGYMLFRDPNTGGGL